MDSISLYVLLLMLYRPWLPLLSDTEPHTVTLPERSSTTATAKSDATTTAHGVYDQKGGITAWHTSLPFNRETVGIHDKSALDTGGVINSWLPSIYVSAEEVPSGGEPIPLLVHEKRVDLHNVVAFVSKKRLREDVEQVMGIRNRQNERASAHLERVRRYIEAEFEEMGIAGRRQKASHEGITIENVIGHITGTRYPDSVIVVGAHIDSEKASPGADDNASGIAGMLEIARILSLYKPEHSIDFVGFDGEEIGWLGSKLYVSEARNSGAIKKIKAVLNFDMIGYYSDRPDSQEIPEGFEAAYPEVVDRLNKNENRGDFIIIISRAEATFIADHYLKSASNYVPDLKAENLEHKGEMVGTLAASDHVPFWRVGVPAIHVSDGADSRNPHYHSSFDRIYDVDFEFLENVVSASLATVAAISEVSH